MYKKISISFLALIILAMSGCSDVEKPTDITVTTQPTIDTSVTTTVTTTTEATTTEATTVITTQKFIPATPKARDYDYEKDLVFVGDSVCKGLRVYQNLLPDTQVFAEGSIGARSVLEYKFIINGGEYSAVEAIKARQPKYIYLWMGMNDLNITEKEIYADNLKNAADEFLSVSPFSKIIIVSITPTTADHVWQANDRINDYNKYVEKFVNELDDDRFSYLNIHDVLINDDGALPEEYQSGDGLHLAPFAYELVLGFVSANQVGYYGEFPVQTTAFPKVEPPVTTTTKPATTTAPTTSAPSPETSEPMMTITPPEILTGESDTHE